METEDDKDFTEEEIRQTTQSIDHKKAMGEVGLTSKMLLRIFERFPLLVTPLYNGCLTFWSRNYFFNFSTPVYKM